MYSEEHYVLWVVDEYYERRSVVVKYIVELGSAVINKAKEVLLWGFASTFSKLIYAGILKGLL